MKILLQLFTIFMFLTSFTSSYACEFLKIQNGTPIQNILQQYQDLDDPMSIGTDKGIWEVQYSASNFCNEEELDDAGLSVITNDTKIVGIKLETSYMSEDKEKLYRYTSKNFGSIDSKLTKNNWTGFFRLDLPGNYIVYERDTYDGQIYEKLLITIPTKIDDVYNEGLREYM